MSALHVRVLGAAAVLAFGLAPVVRADPTLRSAGGWWILRDLPAILDDQEVQRPLTSGLTTTFHLSAEAADGSVGAARVEVRYLLWEEAFTTRVVAPDGNVTDLQVETLADLRRWWRDLEVAVLPMEPNHTPEQSLRIGLDVLPFSAREQEDTQRWLAETLRRGSQSPDLGSAPAEGGLGQVFNVLIATSIKRKSLRSCQWTVPLPAGAAP